MIEKLLDRIILECLNITEKDLVGGHYIDTDFQRYSTLVEALIDIVKEEFKESPIIFTALCLSLFQWFNFDIHLPVKSQGAKVLDFKKMRCDGTWVNYLKFAHNTLKNLNLYRCILCSDKEVEIDDRFKLVPYDVIEAQSNASIIYKDKSPLEPLKKSDINKICGQLGIDYECYKKIEMAYLIVDEKAEDISRDEKLEGYKIDSLKDFFIDKFNRTGHHKIKIVDQTEYNTAIISKNLPQDFFIVGEGDIQNPKWNFGLAANVMDFSKVRLWFISENLHAREMQFDGKWKYETVFNFTDITDYVNLILNKWASLKTL